MNFNTQFLVSNKLFSFKFQLKSFLILLGFLVFQNAKAQYKIPEKPSFIHPVIDSTSTLNSHQEKVIYDKLKTYSDSTSTEIILIIIPSAKGENIGLLSAEWGHKWQIGQEKEDNGVLILLTKNDRKIWISTGYGVCLLYTSPSPRD